MRLAPPTTWLLVSTRPSGATITPEPEPARLSSSRARDVDAHHGRSEAIDHVDHRPRIGVEELAIFRGAGAVGGRGNSIAGEIIKDWNDAMLEHGRHSEWTCAPALDMGSRRGDEKGDAAALCRSAQADIGIASAADQPHMRYPPPMENPCPRPLGRCM